MKYNKLNGSSFETDCFSHNNRETLLFLEGNPDLTFFEVRILLPFMSQKFNDEKKKNTITLDNFRINSSSFKFFQYFCFVFRIIN